ncbi:MAG TPA: hypothetical protein VFB82_22410 [Blastocatellia bacterium]|nr:hypothetical protein [Blastocatellia bacterium]
MIRSFSGIILLCTLALSGCNGCSSNNNDGNVNVNGNSNGNANRSGFTPPTPIKPASTVDPNFKSCNQFFPLVPGSSARYVISYSSGLVADATVVVDASEENGRKVFFERTQIIDRSGGLEITQTSERKYACDGERVQLISEKTQSDVAGQKSNSEFKYRDNSVAMVDPASMSRKGTTWQYAFTKVFNRPGDPPAVVDEPTFVTFEVEGDDEVSIPVGKFKAVKVIRKVGENRITEYFVRGLGLVKRVATEGTQWELREFGGLKATDKAE